MIITKIQFLKIQLPLNLKRRIARGAFAQDQTTSRFVLDDRLVFKLCEVV